PHEPHPAGTGLCRREAVARAAAANPVEAACEHRRRARAVHSAEEGLPLSARPVKRALLLLPFALVLAGCSGSSNSMQPTITVKPAKPYQLIDRSPTTSVAPGKPTTVAFTVQQPSGQPLTQFKTGPGPHTGVHVIIVSDDLSTIIHRHPPIQPDGHV